MTDPAATAPPETSSHTLAVPEAPTHGEALLLAAQKHAADLGVFIAESERGLRLAREGSSEAAEAAKAEARRARDVADAEIEEARAARVRADARVAEIEATSAAPVEAEIARIQAVSADESAALQAEAAEQIAAVRREAADELAEVRESSDRQIADVEARAAIRADEIMAAARRDVEAVQAAAAERVEREVAAVRAEAAAELVAREALHAEELERRVADADSEGRRAGRSVTLRTLNVLAHDAPDLSVGVVAVLMSDALSHDNLPAGFPPLELPMPVAS